MLKLQYDSLIEDYNQGYGVKELSEKYSIHRATVQRMLKRNGVELRKKTPRLKYNIHFFSEYTPESCYWAGFLMADGCVRADRATVALKLSSVDIDHLHKFKNSIGYQGEVFEHEQHGRGYCVISINGRWWIDDLRNNFGIVPRKTFIASFPNIPNNMKYHFIRGVFDGDGCVCFIRKLLVFNIIGNGELMKEIQNVLHENNDIQLKSGNEKAPLQTPHKETEKSKQIKSFHYSGKNAAKILKWIYEGSEDTTRLTRKYNKFMEYDILS
jgi:hypothetical protein